MNSEFTYQYIEYKDKDHVLMMGYMNNILRANHNPDEPVEIARIQMPLHIAINKVYMFDSKIRVNIHVYPIISKPFQDYSDGYSFIVELDHNFGSVLLSVNSILTHNHSGYIYSVYDEPTIPAEITLPLKCRDGFKSLLHKALSGWVESNEFEPIGITCR